MGTPLVVSDIPVFREVGGKAATYVDPDDVAGFVRAIRALDDETAFAAASAAARERAEHYSWERLGARADRPRRARRGRQAARRSVTAVRAITSR